MNRRDRTHAALREAALQLFAERGYDGSTTAQVAKRAGVSEMTLFRHFATKEALLLEDPYDPLMADAVRARPTTEAPMRAGAEGIRSAWRTLPPSDLAGLRGVLRIAAATPSLQGALERSSTETITALAAALEERGVLTGDARVAAAAAIAGLSRALLDWAQDEDSDLDVRVDRALDVLGGR